jgi:hypothetical protein
MRHTGGRYAVDTVEQASSQFGFPQIANTDRGGQFAATALTKAMFGRGVKLLMEGCDA